MAVNKPIDKMDATINESVKKICKILSDVNFAYTDYILDMTAALCGVEKKVIASESVKNSYVLPRWFFWYCVRYLNNESYEKIAERMKKLGSPVSVSGVGVGITKMAFMIESEPIWNSRWQVIKRITSEYHEKNGCTRKEVVKVYIDNPVGVNVEVEFKKK